ncbi:Uncharacterised protein [Candidatus Burarchaeum australiense]|nr:Uncharacterised protein [Candidatus Burarchaeum australiense]
MKNGKKAQAALEFLTTYGWAILVIVLVLVSLTWLGVFNVQQGVSERCTFPADISCLNARVSGTQLTQLTLTNRMTKVMYVCEVACTNDLTLSLGTSIVIPSNCVSSGGASPIFALQPGQQMNLASTPIACKNYFAGKLTTTSVYSLGDTYSGSVIIFYSVISDASASGSGAKARMMTGDIFLKVT